ncbi:para-nitrobenzyl esterase [Herbihabitans rhizosphaerae]|uniref:Carboxylic ester hydrolase n=1 Tax=Herbihabitans rhizosphaerae TaxID=1872711 RepID=A0A4Q7L6K1_9PSEU|nr:carboxylesterase family protein [Herbihabitans rhizosphaerae]RZS44886.1 para-nitrobenzyl esterase [Herbihabitans rhizosphaerae]
MSRRVGVLALAAAALGAVLLGVPGEAEPTGGTVVLTDKGAVRGSDRAGYREFLGVPFAAPPVGHLRWRSPVPRAPWAGIRDATTPGSWCAQHASSTGTPPSLDEDCLYLNVTVPDSAKPTRPKPVMVWLHGGGFIEGSGSEYDPRRMAVQGDVVVVTVNYRLGVFGNFGHPDLPGSGAFGLEDQQAALRWVRRNANAFGGDAGNVTLFGQSAGGQSVCAQLAAPGAAGLFHRAAVQSAFCTKDIPANLIAPGLPSVPPWEKLAAVTDRARRTAVELGCADPADAPACLRRLPAERLMPVFTRFAGLSYGGRTLPENPYEMLKTGRTHQVPVLSGATRDEVTYMQALNDLAGRPLTAERYREYLRAAFGTHADAVAARYPLRDGEPPSRTWATVATDDGEPPSRTWVTVATDSGLACPTFDRNRLSARHVPTYAFEFADRTAPPSLPDVGYPYDAYHSAETFYLFDIRTGNAPPALNAEQRRLGDAMIASWTAFAHTGDPGWPRVHPDKPYTQSLAPGPGGIGPVDFATSHQCGFWSSTPVF